MNIQKNVTKKYTVKYICMYIKTKTPSTTKKSQLDKPQMFKHENTQVYIVSYIFMILLYVVIKAKLPQ